MSYPRPAQTSGSKFFNAQYSRVPIPVYLPAPVYFGRPRMGIKYSPAPKFLRACHTRHPTPLSRPWLVKSPCPWVFSLSIPAQHCSRPCFKQNFNFYQKLVLWLFNCLQVYNLVLEAILRYWIPIKN